MTLAASGQMSIAGTVTDRSIQVELGGNGSTQMSMDDASVRGLAGVASGQINLSTDFYGKTHAVFSGDWSATTQQAKIQASDKLAGDLFGVDVSISGDGTTAILGAWGVDTGGSSAGAAYIFTRSGSTWTEQAKIQASDKQADDRFGYKVSISNDGNTAIISAYLEDTGGSAAGAAYIFTRSGSTWTQQAKIQASDKQGNDRFGTSVSIADDGNTAIVGAGNEDTSASNAGSVYIFTRSGSTWTQQAKIQASDPQAEDKFGNSSFISGDGDTVIVGAEGEDTGGTSAGAAYIFTRSGSTWTQQAKIQSDDIQASDIFGWSVSISGDGNTAIVGARAEDTTADNAGAAYIFTRSGSTWSQQAKIQASDAQYQDYFGYDVSITGDGDTAIIGAYLEDTGGSAAGAAYIFTRSGSTWSQQAKIQASDKQSGDRFGLPVSIADEGSAIVGSYLEDTGGSNAGAAYIFVAG
jgi:hypothetical protein